MTVQAPKKLHADMGHDYQKYHLALRRRGLETSMLGAAVNSSQRLGRHRWVVERTFAWLNRFRRLRVRYKRREDIYLAFTKPAGAPYYLSGRQTILLGALSGFDAAKPVGPYNGIIINRIFHRISITVFCIRNNFKC